MNIFKVAFQKITIAIFFTDNGPHYHNSAVLTYLAQVNAVFGIELVEYNNFEAREGKTVLDTHFAHVSHKLVRWVRVGNDLESGEQSADLLEVRDDMALDRNINLIKEIVGASEFKMNEVHTERQ